MKYTFLLYSDQSAAGEATAEEKEQELAVYGAYIGALQEAGVFLATDWLQPTATASTVSFADGAAAVHDGPFAETQETLGGYFVIEAPDLDVALEWAKKCPAAQYGKVEVRASAMED
ncbi:YciI family protein [Rhodococcus sp. BGS-1C]|uniref:YciI family protein n=1 Tax=unclassified Rhodococcus (in: high G+C Gram-positive bacteria) TaxID=192944 RepID=UPI0019D22573|nr:YciI family protein [Rhodococcus sp. KRD197]